MAFNPRRAALEALYKIEQRKVYAKNAVAEVLVAYPGDFSSRDRALVNSLVYGVTRWKATLDFVVKDFSLSPETQALSPWVKNIIRLGVYQLMFMDKIPAYAAVNESVELVKEFEQMGTVMFVNGLLRKIAENLAKINYPDKKNIIKHLCIKYSYPEWLVRKWVTQQGVEKAISLCKASNRQALLCGRVNLLKNSREEVSEELAAAGIEVYPGKFSAESIWFKNYPFLEEIEAYRAGKFYLQNEAAQLVSYLVDPQPEETILDACASPGGKTTHLAELMGNKGKIYALDLSEFKLSRIKENTRRLGIKIVELLVQDATRLPERFMGRMDRALVDPPCSGLGIISGHPDIKWNRTLREITFQLAKLQLDLLKSAAGTIKSGGILVYSVCSFEPEETTEVITKFLNLYPLFKLEPVNRYLPGDSAKFQDEDGCLCIYPVRNFAANGVYPDEHNLDGFFAARLKKI